MSAQIDDSSSIRRACSLSDLSVGKGKPKKRKEKFNLSFFMFFFSNAKIY